MTSVRIKQEISTTVQDSDLVLPRNWRIRVVEKLLVQGDAIKAQTVSDLLNGKIKNLDLLKKVLDAKQIISKEYVEAEAERKALLSG